MEQAKSSQSNGYILHLGYSVKCCFLIPCGDSMFFIFSLSHKYLQSLQNEDLHAEHGKTLFNHSIIYTTITWNIGVFFQMSMVDCCHIFKMFSLHPFFGIFTFYFTPTEFQEFCLTVTRYSVRPEHTDLNLSD